MHPPSPARCACRPGLAVIDRLGHLPTSAYFEWPVAAPHRPLHGPGLSPPSEGLVAQPDGYTIDFEAMAVWLGLGRTGQNAPLLRRLRRLVRFHLAHQVDEGTLAVPRQVPPLNERQVRHLDPTLQRTHFRLANSVARGAPAKAPAAS